MTVKKTDVKKKQPKVDINAILEENKELKDKTLRITAEMQNFVRRSEAELTNYLKYDGEEFIKKLLPIVDDFERAIGMDDDNLDDEVSKFLSGFKMIYATLLNILTEYEIKEIECLGKEFNPDTMNAVMTDKIIEEESNIVLDVMQKGYLYKDKVIRPAMVKVNE